MQVVRVIAFLAMQLLLSNEGSSAKKIPVTHHQRRRIRRRHSKPQTHWDHNALFSLNIKSFEPKLAAERQVLQVFEQKDAAANFRQVAEASVLVRNTQDAKTSMVRLPNSLAHQKSDQKGSQKVGITGQNVADVDFKALAASKGIRGASNEAAVLTAWTTADGELLAIGSDATEPSVQVVRDDLMRRGVGGFIIANEIPSVGLAMLPIRTGAKSKARNADAQRVMGSVVDVATVEWAARSLYTPANEILQPDRGWRFLYHVNRLCHTPGPNRHLTSQNVLPKQFQSTCTAKSVFIGKRQIHQLTCPRSHFNRCSEIFHEQYTALEERAHDKIAFRKKYDNVRLVRARNNNRK